jgi:hypothetical protein
MTCSRAPTAHWIPRRFCTTPETGSSTADEDDA